MIYRFDDYVLDTDRAELRNAVSGVVQLERQIFLLLKLLVENGDVLTTRDEIVKRIWGGRAISDAAIDSRISGVRRAIGDDGRCQVRIRTVRGQGLRFVAPVVAAASSQVALPIDSTEGGRPSIAVLPFRRLQCDARLAVLCEALPYELILRLSRLHWLAVIARGSCFHFRDGQSADEVGTALDARYVLRGTLERIGSEHAISTILADARSGRIVWAERYRVNLDEAFDVRDRIARAIVTELDSRIPLHEALEAQSIATDDLDAWSSYHLGLMHAYRFTLRDNACATMYFRRALAIDPHFARAHAGLSFSRFQDAFTFYGDDRAAAMNEARAAAERAMELDPRDPFANFNLGRYHWLDNDLDAGRLHLERAVALNPNYAQALYSLAFTNAICGWAPEALEKVAQSIRLSPLDPLLYGMLGTRSLSLLHQGKLDEAANWGDRAARAPAAHFLIGMIAVATHSLNANDGKARDWADLVRQRRPDATHTQFLRSFPLRNPHIREQIESALRRHGF